MLEQPLTYTTTLACHPATLSQAVHAIGVRVSWAQPQQENMLVFTYTLSGDCDELYIPSARPPIHVDGLWRHTCFETFISAASDSAYWEFNFSPSGEWARYFFSSYRNPLPSGEEESPPTITTNRTNDCLQVKVILSLPRTLIGQPLQLALSAIIEEQNGRLSYWALQHPSGKPDFHHAEAFALAIAPPSFPTARRESV